MILLDSVVDHIISFKEISFVGFVFKIILKFKNKLPK